MVALREIGMGCCGGCVQGFGSVPVSEMEDTAPGTGLILIVSGNSVLNFLYCHFYGNLCCRAPELEQFI